MCSLFIDNYVAYGTFFIFVDVLHRELHAKAKRLARFKDELSQPVESHSTVRNQTAKMQHQSTSERERIPEDPKVDLMGDAGGGTASSEYEGVASSNNIVGICPDMCPGAYFKFT